jgi:hypothetical protein
MTGARPYLVGPNTMYHLAEAYFLAAFIAAVAAGWGALAAGSSLLPVLFQKTLDPGHAAVLLRAYWPGYFKFAMALGVATTLGLALFVPLDALPTLYTLFLTSVAGLMTICFFGAWRLIPAINQARDDDVPRAFHRLHRLNVLLTACGLLAGVTLLSALIYVLPGQFTFWQWT